MKNFWQTLPKPIFVLAPMEDVTDTVFRQILLTCGRPTVFFTEFTNVDGLASEGRKRVINRLQFSPEEKPLIAQIWGMKPENYFKAAQEIVEMGFDGIDINMGCPQSDVIRHGACSALIMNHTLAKEIIQATKEGAANKIPVSVKTRIGFKKNQREEWFSFLFEQNLPLLTVHGRTAAEMSKVPAHWDEIGKVVQMRNAANIETLIFGNGDIQSLEEAEEKVKKYQVDGVMVGRGIFHNPWLFDKFIDPDKKTLSDRLTLLKNHVELFEKTWGNTKHFPLLKKYFKIYLSGFDGAAEIRTQFMEAENFEDVYFILKQYEI